MITNILQNKEIYGIIYCVTNSINKKKYVGQTIRNLNDRWYQHKYQALNYNSQIYFHRAIRKYGEENFSIEILDYAYSSEELNQKEEDWIYILNTLVPSGYNMTSGGEYGFWSDTIIFAKPNLNKHWFHNELNQRLFLTKDEIIPEGFVLGNIPRSFEEREKIKHSSIIKYQNQLEKQKTKEAMIKYYQENPMSDERENNISKYTKLAMTNEVIAKIKKALIGRKWFYNPSTNESDLYFENTQPINWIRGRPKKY